MKMLRDYHDEAEAKRKHQADIMRRDAWREMPSLTPFIKRLSSGIESSDAVRLRMAPLLKVR